MKPIWPLVVFGVILIALGFLACSNHNPTAPDAIQIPEVTQNAPQKVTTKAFDIPTKHFSNFYLNGNTVVWHATDKTGNGFGPFFILLFNFETSPQTFLGAGGPYWLSAGETGDFTASFEGCGIVIQTDAYLTSEVTEEIKHLKISGGYLLDAGWLSSGACAPKKNEPPPTQVDLCPNIEGIQTSLQEGYTIVEGRCVPELLEPTPSPSPTPSPTPEPTPSPTPSPEPTPSPSPTPTPSPSPTPTPISHGACIYEIAGKKSQKQSKCEVASGIFDNHDGSDHCVFPFPGVALDGFNLAPGLSDPDCLRKQDQ